MRTWQLAALVTVVVATIAVIAVTASLVSGPAHPAAATATGTRFDKPRQNPYYPLRPGTVSRYRGTDDGERLHEDVTVTREKKTIQGVATTVVRDVLLRADGSLAEKTDDWYATDDAGNVWYFGEQTATYDEHGHLDSREGSWQAGVDGAVAGMIMPAAPKPADAYRQEFLRGHAEDQAWVVQRDDSSTVPYGRLGHVVRTFEWSRLEPGVLSEKLYAPGLGIVAERDLSGGTESFELVAVEHG